VERRRKEEEVGGKRGRREEEGGGRRRKEGEGGGRRENLPNLGTCFSIEDLINNLLQDESLVTFKEGVSITYFIQDDVPSVLVGDLNILRKILSHLLHNAIKV
jgi:signal transduction histidine kinase